MFDAELYRSKAEVESWKQRCPIKLYAERLMREGTLTAADLKGIEAEADAEIAAAVAYAEAGTCERVEDLTRDVYTPHTA
jgi:TPP-dependent pyruvate/acetoin dehydrogenase alpha subunit